MDSELVVRYCEMQKIYGYLYIKRMIEVKIHVRLKGWRYCWKNKALSERFKGMILYLRLKWLWVDKSRFDQEKKMSRRDLERMLSLPPRRG